jgi:transposase
MSADVVKLQDMLRQALEANARHAATNQRLEQENKLLRDKLDQIIRRMWGAKSEKLDEAQMLLLLQGLDEAPKKPESPAVPVLEDEGAKKKRKNSPRKPVFPEGLPVKVTNIDPEEVLANPQAWRRIGEEISDRYDYEPASFFTNRIVRGKYVSVEAPHEAPVIAPLPGKIKDRHSAGPGLLAAIITGKYCDHLPLYRQENIYMSRHGVYLPRQTMSLWMDDAADWLGLIYRHIRQGVFAGGYVQMDEIPVSFLEPGNGKTIKGYLWGCNRPGGGVIYDWSWGGRGMDRLDELLPEDYAGRLQSDGLAVYSGHARRHAQRIIHHGCWAHVRRPFLEAAETGCRKAAIVVRLIGLMYADETAMREAGCEPVLREARRASCGLVVARRIFALLERWRRGAFLLPASATAKAIDYTLKRRAELERCLCDGLVEIDNNLMENSLRPIAVGRKNWLFFGSREAGQKSAVLFTIVENCRRQGIDPFAYLRDVFENVGIITNRNVDDWTPEGWARRHGQGRAARRSA